MCRLYLQSYVKEINNTIKKIINSKNQNQDNRLDLSDYSLEQTAKKIKKVYQDSLESPATQSLIDKE